MNIVFVESLGMCECTINKSLATLKNQGHTVTFYHDRNENEEVLIERARNAEVVVVSNIPLRKHFFENCPKLRMLSVAFTGVDHIDLEECKKRGITVCNAAGYSTEAVAELTIGMMIAVYRKMVGGDAILRIGGDRQGVLGSELYGKTVGIVGLGAIGHAVAELAGAFGCEVAYHSVSGNKRAEKYPEMELMELLKWADILSIHSPLNERTRGLIGMAELRCMKPTAILVNVARGGIVDEQALADALDGGILCGAVVDVFSQEPIPADNPLLKIKDPYRLLLSPHNAWSAQESIDNLVQAIVENIQTFLKAA